MKKIIASLTIFLLTNSFALANERTRIANNLSHAYVTCSVFYSIGFDGIKTMPDTTNEDLQRLINTKKLSIEIAQIFGDIADVSQDAHKARFSLAYQGMLKEMNYNFSNFSILLAKYGDNCKKLIENPVVIMEKLNNIE